MIDYLLKKKTNRDFLKNYSINQWPKLISDIFEISILNLQKSFNTSYFSNEDLHNLIYELKQPLLEVSPKKQIINLMTEKSISPKPTLLNKPSTYWRHGDSYDYNADKIKEIRDNYHSRSPSQDEEDRIRTKQIRKKIRQQQQLNNSKEDMYESIVKSRSNSKGRPRKVYHINKEEIKEKNRENSMQRRIIESKIKDQVQLDKKMNRHHKTQMNDKIIITENSEKNKNGRNKRKNNHEKNSDTNYIITYDKDLQPDTIQKKLKDNDEIVYCTMNETERNDIIDNKEVSSINQQNQTKNVEDKEENNKKEQTIDNKYSKHDNSRNIKDRLFPKGLKYKNQNNEAEVEDEKIYQSQQHQELDIELQGTSEFQYLTNNQQSHIKDNSNNNNNPTVYSSSNTFDKFIIDTKNNLSTNNHLQTDKCSNYSNKNSNISQEQSRKPSYFQDSPISNKMTYEYDNQDSIKYTKIQLYTHNEQQLNNSSINQCHNQQSPINNYSIQSPSHPNSFMRNNHYTNNICLTEANYPSYQNDNYKTSNISLKNKKELKGQLSMLKISEKTKTLFQKEMNKWSIHNDI